MSKALQFVIFLIVSTVILILAYIFNDWSYKKQVRFAVLSLAVLLFMYSFRTLGLDINNYRICYDSTQLDAWRGDLSIQRLFSNDYEPLFVLMMYLCKLLRFPFAVFLLVVYLFPFTIFGKHIVRSKKPLAYLFAFTLLMLFHVDLTRSFVALGFIFFAYKSKNKALKLLFYAIAFGFHYSALVAMAIELLVYLRKWRIYKFLVVLGVAFLISCKFVDYSFLSASKLRFVFKAQYYLFRSETLDDPWLLNVFYLLINIFPIVFSFYYLLRFNRFVPKNREENTKDKCFIAICALAGAVFLIIFQTVQLSFRIVFISYFAIFASLGAALSENMDLRNIKFKGASAVLLLMIFNVLMITYYYLASYYY